MRKLRIMILAAASLLLLRQSPTTVQAGSFTGCVKSVTTSPDTIYCDACCTVSKVSVTYLDDWDGSPGFTSLFYNDPPSCGSVKGTADCQASNPTCGSTNQYYYTANSNDPQCCPPSGFSCVAGQCCPPNTCINNECVMCASNYGQPCTGGCGTPTVVGCDGLCVDPIACIGDSDCDGGLCWQGCCTSSINACNGAASCSQDSDCSPNCCNNGCCDTSGNCEAGGGGCGDIYMGHNQWDCGGNVCDYGCNSDGCNCVYAMDPIMVDLSGGDLKLTSTANGLKFDMLGNGKPIQMARSAPNSGTAFLALDRDGDGRIDNGAELFGVVTPQPTTAHPLGFKALAIYDQPANGGNRDGWIDAKDAVFSRLRLWLDANHNGISDVGELLTMDQAGITAISVHYLPDNGGDQYGNRFQNRATILWSGQKNGRGQGDGGGTNHWAYDVVLVSDTRK